MRRKGLKAPFALTTLVLLFGRKKEPEDASPAPTEAILDPRTEAFPTPASLKKTVTGNDVNKARDRLRLASLERDNIGEALTKNYEAETRGKNNEVEKNHKKQK